MITLTNNGTVLFGPVGPDATVATFDKSLSEKLVKTSFNALDFDFGWGATMAWWMRIPVAATVGEGYCQLGEVHVYGSSGGLFLGDSNSSPGLLAFYIGNNTSFVGTNWTNGVDSNIADGLWHFLVFRYDPTTMRGHLMLDGDPSNDTLTASLTGNHPALSTTGGYSASLFFGGSGLGATYMTGEISRAGVFNYYLQQSAIEYLYNRGKGRAYADLSSDFKTGNRLISYYNMDEASGNRADSHGSNTLTDTNTVLSVTHNVPANHPGTAASFLASRSEYFNCAASGVIASGQPRTVAFWFQSTTDSGNPSLISVGNSVADSSRLFGINYAGTTPNKTLGLYSNGGSTNSAGFFSVGDWVFVVYTFDGVSEHRVYANNTLRISRSGADSGNPNNFYIGTSAAGYASGKISNVLVLHKVANQDELDALWEGGAGLFFAYSVSLSPSASVSPSASASSSPSPSVPPPLSDALGIFKMETDTTWTDELGYFPSFTEVGSVSLGTGIDGNCADFPGSAALTQSDDAKWNFVSTGFSVNVWINRDPGAEIHLLAQTNGSSEGWGAGPNGAGIVGFTVFNDGGGSSTVNSGSISDSAWHMVTFGWNQSNKKPWISVDGAAKTEGTALANTLLDGTGSVRVGNYPGGTYEGLLDELVIWDRTLSDTEISDLWNGGSGIFW